MRRIVLLGIAVLMAAGPAGIPRVVGNLPAIPRGLSAMQQVNRPNVMDFMSASLLSRLTPQAKQVLSRTPLFAGGNQADIWPQLIRLQQVEPVVANHEAMHILSYQTLGMTDGRFPGLDVPLDFQLRMASQYGNASQQAMTQYSTGGETYPMALQVAGWNPWAIPEMLKPYYSQWMDMRPPSTWWH